MELPQPVREGLQVWAGGSSLGPIEMRSWDPNEADVTWSIVAETLRIRASLRWPRRYVYLAEQSESIVVLDAATGRVSWFDSVLAPTLSDGELPEDNADSWTDYLAFLVSLCDEEQKDQEED